MLASVHVVDGTARSTLGALRRSPSPTGVAGLRDAKTLIAAPLGGSPPQLGRRALVAMWDDAAALDAFLETDPVASTLRDGFSARLEPVRAVPVAAGPWPGLPPGLPAGRVPDPAGPTVVLTIARLRVREAVRFFRASARAERQVLDAPGLLWATGLANITQRVVATLSIWESVPPAREYVTHDGHADAMRDQARRSFHHYGSFIRFRPLAATGSLAGRNPLPERVTAALGTAPPA